ncbi:MAG: hypothetical protein U0T82_04410 [Bacteroidales bacterium]
MVFSGVDVNLSSAISAKDFTITDDGYTTSNNTLTLTGNFTNDGNLVANWERLLSDLPCKQ